VPTSACFGDDSGESIRRRFDSLLKALVSESHDQAEPALNDARFVVDVVGRLRDALSGGGRH